MPSLPQSSAAGRVQGRRVGPMQPLHVLSLCLVLECGLGQIKILSPPELSKQFADSDGVIYGSTATFGAPYYDERVVGRLMYGESTQGHDHCTKDDYDLKDTDAGNNIDVKGGSKKPFNVVVVRRGQCTFVQKVRIAQEKHAHAVIMIDKKNSQKTPEEIQRVVMADDGFGSTVKIPSVLISNHEGEKLIQSMKTDSVIVELAWSIPRAEVVLADFWMSSGSEESFEFLEKFKDPAETLKFHMQFVPHFHVFSLPPGSSYGHLCADASKARHCAPDPDGPGPITGQMVVNEDLRELCLWHVSAEPNPYMDPAEKGATYSKNFWEYVVRRRSECSLAGTDPSYTFGEKCSLRLMTSLGVDVAAIESCTRSKADLYLDAEVENVAWSPQALRLNGWRYNGPLDHEAVLKAICSGFKERPAQCAQLLEGRFSHVFSIEVAGISLSTLFVSVAFLVGILAALFYMYKSYMTTSVRKVLREEVMLEVQSQMADYTVLEEDGRNRSSAPLSF